MNRHRGMVGGIRNALKEYISVERLRVHSIHYSIRIRTCRRKVIHRRRGIINYQRVDEYQLIIVNDLINAISSVYHLRTWIFKKRYQNMY